jgi:quercetin dioxygenase-like cupin family protein
VNLQYETGRTILNKQSAKIASLVVAAAAFSMISLAGPTWGGASKPGHESLAFSTPLPNVPGKSLTAIVATFEPGASSPVHHHAGSVYAYVLTGTIRSENSATGPEREYKAGESFFEPPGSVHLVTANASETEAASLLAVFIADEGATLTMPGK